MYVCYMFIKYQSINQSINNTGDDEFEGIYRAPEQQRAVGSDVSIVRCYKSLAHGLSYMFSISLSVCRPTVHTDFQDLHNCHDNV